ncbi:MAG: hypothetical protein U1A78_25170 [Polyangia bacterium]
MTPPSLSLLTPQTEPAAESVAFTVLDVLGGLFGLRRRSPTLDGAVPLRAAQACVPLLQGNALGHQVVLTRPLRLVRRLGGFVLDAGAHESAPPAALQRLVERGHLAAGGRWHERLRHGPVWAAGSPLGRGLGLGTDRFCLWTGLLVRPEPDVWLQLLGAANRRSTAFEVAEVTFADASALVPLVLELRLTAREARTIELQGELATLVPLSPGATLRSRPLESAPELGRAHARFYDAAYFARKKQGPTRRYRRQIDTQAPALPELATDAVPAACEVVETETGPSPHELLRCARFATREDPAAGPPASGPAFLYAQFRNLVRFTLSYDGQALRLDYDRAALRARAAPLWQRWRALYGAEFVAAHRGALLYLSKYFTQHPPGEPYFFVKPWAFLRTPPGWSCIVEGVHGDGYDVLRGVIATDQFFALPAVFHVHALHRTIEVAAGAPLLRALPVPRRLLGAGFRAAPWEG